MSRIWRWITPVAVAGGLVAGVPAIPAATASATATSIITINATSPNFPRLPAKDDGKVDGYAIVVYKGASGANTATVSGTVTTTATNDTATLLAESFGATKYKPVATEALTVSGTASYSFNVTPSLATNYKVQVTGTDTAVSSVVTVYAGPGESSSRPRQRCSHTRCTYSFRFYVYVPTAKAYKTESGKHLYLYLAVGYPHLPKDFTLSSTATASAAKKVNSREYEQTLTYYIPLRKGSAFWEIQFCTKDTESTDGLGLPGHHGCGAKRVSRSVTYLG